MLQRLVALCALVLISLPIGGPSARAQTATGGAAIELAQTSDMAQNVDGETLDLYVGDIVEILPLHDIAEPTFAWILTQERTFVQASRAPYFRARLIQPGVYTLDVEVGGAGGTERVKRTVTVNVQPRDPRDPPAPPGTGTGSAQSGPLVTTVPPLDATGNVVLDDERSIMQLVPLHADIFPLTLDLDTTSDANGDGDPASDPDSEGTFFQSDATPLYLWMLRPLTELPMRIVAVASDGNPITQDVRLLSAAEARAQGIATGDVRIETEEIGPGRLRFSAAFTAEQDAGIPLLYNWNFGDGAESLLKAPEHTYAEPGAYTVTLTVRNLLNGSVIGTTTQEVTVATAAGTVSSADASAPAEPQQEEPADTANEGRGLFSVPSILLYGGIFFGSILLGVVIISLLSRLKQRKPLSDRIEEMEQSMLKQQPQKESSAAPLPIAAVPPTQTQKSQNAAPQKEAAPTQPGAGGGTDDEEAAKREVIERERLRALEDSKRSPTPTIEPEKAPPWLKQGLSATAPEPGSPAASAPQSPPRQPVAEPQQPAPARAPAANMMQEAPPWLRPQQGQRPPASNPPAAPRQPATPEGGTPSGQPSTAASQPPPAGNKQSTPSAPRQQDRPSQSATRPAPTPPRSPAPSDDVPPWLKPAAAPAQPAQPSAPASTPSAQTAPPAATQPAQTPQPAAQQQRPPVNPGQPPQSPPLQQIREAPQPSPSRQPPPAPQQGSQPSSTAAGQAPRTPPPADDTPIAFIRADSIEERNDAA